jgi:cell division protease FtsH
MTNPAGEPKKKPTERRFPGLGGNFILYIFIAAIFAVILVGLLVPRSDYEIPYSEFVALVRQKSPDQNPAALIQVDEGTASAPRPVRYSGLREIRVGPFDISGKATREELLKPFALDPGTGKPDWQGTLAVAKASGKSGTKLNKEVSFRTDIWGLEQDDGRLQQLLIDNGFSNVRGERAPSGLRSWLMPLLIFGLLAGLVILIVRRIGGAGSPIAFGRSRGKMYAQEDIGVTFEDVAGIDEAVEELREVVEFLRTPEKYQILGGRIPKGILLVGPPGTGKTLLAKAIAGEAGVPFFSLSGSDFVEMFVGVGAARVRDMFQQAEAKAPCIVFIDELDALGKTRGSSIVGGHDEREQTLNALLVEMDGFDSNSGVIVLAATNRPETLDPALLRPGRFDRHVLVDRPDVRGREEILKVHVQNVKLDEGVSLREVAAITSGFVGADLANLVNEAALLAARNGKSAVGMVELNEGVERVTAGLEKKQRIIHADEKQRVAYHESGHALVAYSLPNTDPVHKVSIIPRGLAALGYMLQRPEGDRYLLTQQELESRIQVLLAGTLAEELTFGDVSTGAQNDLERATEIARSMVMEYGMSRLGRVTFREGTRTQFLGAGGDFPRDRPFSEQTAREIDEEVRHIIDSSIERVRRILENRRPTLVSLAERLIEKEVIDAEELKRIVEETSQSPAIVPGTTVERKRSAAPEKLSAEQAEHG